MDILLHNVHFNGEKHGQGPEPKSPEQTHNVTKKRKHHRDECGDHHKGCPPENPKEVKVVGFGGAWDRDLDVLRDEFGGGEHLGCLEFDEGEEGLAEHLVGTDEVDHDG